MVRDPSLRELVEFIELGFRIAFGHVFHFDPVDQGLLDPLSGEVGMEFLDALYGLLKVEPLCTRPDHFAFPGVELDILQQRPNDIAYFHVLPAFGGVHPVGELVDERVVCEDAVLRIFLALPAHAVLERIWANAARFVLARSRAFRSIQGAVRVPEYPWLPILSNVARRRAATPSPQVASAVASSCADHEHFHG